MRRTICRARAHMAHWLVRAAFWFHWQSARSQSRREIGAQEVRCVKREFRRRASRQARLARIYNPDLR